MHAKVEGTKRIVSHLGANQTCFDVFSLVPWPLRFASTERARPPSKINKKLEETFGEDFCVVVHRYDIQMPLSLACVCVFRHDRKPNYDVFRSVVWH